MSEFLRWALVPLMRVLSAAVSRDYDGIPRPRDSPQAHSPGNDSDRILIFGNGPAAGWGVLSHDVALPGSLARALSVRTGRGTDVDVVANPQVTIRTAQAELDGLGLWRYDAVVVSVGTSDAITLLSARVWRRELSELLDRIERESSLNTRIFVLGVQPIRSIAAFDSALGAVAEKHARRLNAASAALCVERAQIHFVPMGANLSPTPGRVRTSAHYTQWAEALADRMAPPLDADHLDAGGAAAEVRAVERGAEQHSPGPRRAVDRLTGIGTAAEVACDRLVALARSTYGTSSAALTFVDGDRLWDMVHLGFTPRVYPLAGSITALAVSGAGAFVVSDALVDDRFAARPPEAGQAATRFYAGFPIEADSGERIGVLCVFDTKPRRRNEVDTVLLRELALSIQAELSERPE